MQLITGYKLKQRNVFVFRNLKSGGTLWLTPAPKNRSRHPACRNQHRTFGKMVMGIDCIFAFPSVKGWYLN